MEAIIFCGIQASGKSTFYKERFFSTHVRINLDMLKTRNREKLLMQFCLQTGQPFVVDNTNPTKVERRKYIEAAKAAGFRAVGYYFQSEIEACKQRNANRPEPQQIPLGGVLGTYCRLELPSFEDGFDELHYVRIGEDREFIVEEWSNEV